VIEYDRYYGREEILTVEEAAGYLKPFGAEALRAKLRRATIWRWCRDGKLPAFRIGRHWRVCSDELEKLISANMVSLKREEDSEGYS